MPNLYSEQIVRDLAWLFQSSPLIQATHFGFEELEICNKWLCELDKSPRDLLDFMAHKNLKMLGPYFEALWEFYFLNYKGVRLVAKNLQVFEINLTIGEFDFIYQNLVNKEYYHLEVAIKYFLGLDNQDQKCPSQLLNDDSLCDEITSDKSSMQHWIGPNANDRLDKKYYKMLNHQSKLSETNAGKKMLKEFNIDEIKSQVCLLGTLFYPVNSKNLTTSPTSSRINIQPPEKVHPEHNKGYWIKIEDVEEHLPNTVYWQIIDKPHWMAPIIRTMQALDNRATLLNKLSKYFVHNHRPLLISDFKVLESEQKDLCYSLNKYFIVPNSWPLQQ